MFSRNVNDTTIRRVSRCLGVPSSEFVLGAAGFLGKPGLASWANLECIAAIGFGTGSVPTRSPYAGLVLGVGTGLLALWLE